MCFTGGKTVKPALVVERGEVDGLIIKLYGVPPLDRKEESGPASHMSKS